MASMTESTFWILASLSSGRRHGYAIARDVETISDGEVRLRATTLYAALERLARAGLVDEAGEEIVGGRARRYYALAETGRAALAAETRALESRASAARSRMLPGAATRGALA